jgi:DinB superfamily
MTPAELRQRLDIAHQRLLEAIAGLTEEQLKRRPAGDDAAWSISEVLAHLLANQRLWPERVSLALREDGATVTPSPPEGRDAEARRGRSAPVPQLVHGLLAARREVERLLALSTMPDGGWLDRGIWHPRLERRLTVEYLFDKRIASHVEEHAEQVEQMRADLGAGTVAKA